MGAEPAHCRDQFQSRSDRPFGVIFMGLWVTEVCEDAIAQISRHETIEAAHSLGHAFLIGRDDLAQVFRVHARR